MVKVGIISDTHSLLREQAIDALSDSDFIIHAGDIGAPEVIDKLKDIAPVTAIRGNIDKASWAIQFSDDEVLRIGDSYIYVIHNIHDLDLDPIAAGFQVVVSGHSHKPQIERINDILYINPGSAGPRRFSLPVTVAKLEIDREMLNAEIIELVS